MTRYFSSTEPFAPIVEYMIALRRLRFEAAEADGRTAAAAALAAAIFRKDRRFIINSFGYRGVSGAGRVSGSAAVSSSSSRSMLMPPIAAAGLRHSRAPTRAADKPRISGCIERR